MKGWSGEAVGGGEAGAGGVKLTSPPEKTTFKKPNLIKIKSPLDYFYIKADHCVKTVRIRSYSGPHFPACGLNTERYSVSFRI